MGTEFICLCPFSDGAAVEAEATVAVEAEEIAAMETEETAAVEAEEIAAMETEETAAVEAEGIAAMETEETAAVETEATAAVETEATAAVETLETEETSKKKKIFKSRKIEYTVSAEKIRMFFLQNGMKDTKNRIQRKEKFS